MKELFKILFGNKFTIAGKTYKSKTISSQGMLVMDVMGLEEDTDGDITIDLLGPTETIDAICEYVKRTCLAFGVEIQRSVDDDDDASRAWITLPDNDQQDLAERFVANIILGDISCSCKLNSIYFISKQAEYWKRNTLKGIDVSALKDVKTESGYIQFGLVKFGYDGKTVSQSQSLQTVSLPFAMDYIKQMLALDFHLSGKCYTLDIKKDENEVTVYVFQ